MYSIEWLFPMTLMVSYSQPRTTKRPWKGRDYITWHVLNFRCHIHISGMAEARALKLSTEGDYIKCGQRDDKSPLKGAWFCSRDPFFVCTAVELEQNLHCTRWFAINRVLDDGYRVSHLRRSTLVLHTLRLKLHRFDFSPCLLQSCLYNIHV